MADIPPPPPGFKLDAANIPPPPAGFKLDSAPAAPKEGQGFIGRAGEDISKRWQEGQQAASEYTAGKISSPEMLLRSTGKVVAGSLSDVAGEAVKSAVGELPDFVKSGAKAGAGYLAGTDFGKDVLGAVQTGQQKYGEFATAHPRAAANIESLVDIAGALPSVKAAEIVGSGAKVGVESLPKAAKFTKDIAEDLKPEPIMSHEEIKGISTQKYQQAEKLGGTLKPEVTDKWLTSLNDLVPKGEIAKELSENMEFRKLIDRLQIAKGKPITLQDAQEIDELLGAAADNHFKPAGMTKEGQKILEIQKKFRDAITDAKETDLMGGAQGFKAWDDAKFYWSQSMKQRDIEKIIERASLTQNPTTAMKTGFKNLYTSAKNSRAYTDAEKAAIKNAATTGLVDEVMRLPASRLISIGRIAAGGGLGEAAAAKATSMAADSLRTAHQLGKANKISREISKSVQNRIAESKKAKPPMLALPAPETVYQAGKSGTVPTTAQQMKAGRFQSEFDKANQQIAQQKLAKAPSNVQGITPEMIQSAQEKLALQGKQPSEFGNLLSQIFSGQQP